MQVKNRCLKADLIRAQEQCQEAFRNPAWVPCAVHLSLDPYLLRCTHSLCLFGGLNQALCQALQAFEADCLTQGLRVDIWRNSSFCRECPAYPHNAPYLCSFWACLESLGSWPFPTLVGYTAVFSFSSSPVPRHARDQTWAFNKQGKCLTHFVSPLLW